MGRHAPVAVLIGPGTARRLKLRTCVTGGTGEAIIGAVVKLKGEGKGVSTDIDGSSR